MPFLALALTLLLQMANVAPPAFATVSALDTWDLLAAGERTAVLETETALNATTLNNGTYFYNNPDKSMGFAANSTIQQNSADVRDRDCDKNQGGHLRLSWHRDDERGVFGGWRYGCEVGLNSADDAVRAVFHSDSPSYYPSGPQVDVSNATLVNSGWEVCYIGAYSETVAFSTISDACSKQYIVLAGGAGSMVPLLSAPSVSSHSSTTSSITLTFSAVSNASSYTAYLYASSSGGTPVKTVTSYTSGTAITGLSSGTTYYATLASVGDNINYATSAQSTPRYEAATLALSDQTISWSPSTSLTLADSGLTLSATLTVGDGTLGYSVVDAGTTGCEVDGSSLTFSSTGSGANGCEVRPTATGTSNFNAKNDATTVTFDVARGTFALTAPSSKVVTSSSIFTDVCTSSCDVTGFAPSDEILVVVSKSDGSELSGLVRLDDDSGLNDVTGYTTTPTGASGYGEIAFEGTQAEVNAALETLQYKSPIGGSDETVGISASLAGAAYFAGTEHYYEVISGDNKNHADAITAAASKTFNGLDGYLATILTEEENRFIDEKISDPGVWIGGKYNGTVWQWITGPGDEQIDFWTGTNPGAAISGVYAGWEPEQPDGSDDCLSTNYDGNGDGSGNWDDLTCSATKQWVVEYGGNGGTALKEASATFTVGLPAPASSGSDEDDGDDSRSASPAPNPRPLDTPGVLRGTPGRPLPTPQSPRPQILTGPVTTPGGLPSTPEPSARPRARIGGVPAPTTTTRSNDGGVEVQAGGVRLGVLVRGQDPGGGVEDNPMTGDPEIKVPTGGSTTLRGGGLLPGTSVQVWLPGSDGRELGRVPVGPDGSFEGDVTFGSTQGETPLPIGRQMVQVTGFDAEGNQTVVDMPVNIAQGPPTPEPNRQVDALPDLSQGQSLGTSAGVPVEIVVTGVPDQRLVTVEGDGWNYAVETDGTGVVENGDGQTSMTVRQSRTAEVNGFGLQPGTTASLWLFSEPTLLGTVQVSDDGTFSTKVFVDPQFVAPGEHTLQIQAVGTDGYIKAANLGVLVEEPLAATASDEAGSLLGWAIAGIAVVVAILVWFLLWGRRRSALSA